MMACAPCSALCARLGVVCAAVRCVCGPTLCALGAVSAARAIFCWWFFVCVRCVCAFAHVDGMCALLDTVCAPHCVCDSRFAQYFFCLHHYSEIRMLHFFPLAACCWLVAVSSQTMNAADVAALNQTLTGLGCWRSSVCKVQNFNCGGTGAVQCNANGSVTYL